MREVLNPELKLFMVVQKIGGRSQELNLPGTAGGTNWI